MGGPCTNVNEREGGDIRRETCSGWVFNIYGRMRGREGRWDGERIKVSI